MLRRANEAKSKECFEEDEAYATKSDETDNLLSRCWAGERAWIYTFILMEEGVT